MEDDPAMTPMPDDGASHMTHEREVSGRPIEELTASDKFRTSLMGRADADRMGAPLWHGWALMDAFLAGIDYAKTALRARDSVAVGDGWQLIAEERQRQVTTEGWTAEHDDQHTNKELMLAAMCYLEIHRNGIPMQTAKFRKTAGDYHHEKEIPISWPWDSEWWKPNGRERDLIRSGALMLAERDRLTRLGHQVHHIDHKLNICLNMLAVSPPARGESVTEAERQQRADAYNDLELATKEIFRRFSMVRAALRANDKWPDACEQEWAESARKAGTL